MKPGSKAFVWVLVVFILGSLFGAGLTSVVVRSRVAFLPPWVDFRPDRASVERRVSSEGFLRRMAQALELDEAQRREVRRIMEESREELSRETKEFRNRSIEIRRQTMRKIRTILKPEQSAKLDEFLKTQRERSHRRPE